MIGAEGLRAAARGGIHEYLLIAERGGIDTTKGLTNCGGDPDFYRSILFEYYSGAEEKKEDLRKFLEVGNLENYGILIHSLKSTSAMIGANAPYQIALELEAAAQKNDREFVLSNHESFLKKYQTVLDALKKVVSENDEMKDIPPEEDGIMEFLPE